MVDWPGLSFFVEVVTTFTARGAGSVNELTRGTSLRGHHGLSSGPPNYNWIARGWLDGVRPLPH
jgi:hypothetical protein